MKTRTEHDLLGNREVPAHAYWGIHTLRALENFPITGVPIGRCPDLVNALAQVKHAAALANRDLGILDAGRAEAVVAACARIAEGHLHDQFVVDVLQGGAGTSTNMNANEVIANLALEYLGHARGEYEHLHPIEHVNASQSTNDAYPSALKLSLSMALIRLRAALVELRSAWEEKAFEFRDVVKLGRTQLQDAVPMTLGQEFRVFAVMLADDEERLNQAREALDEVNLGATAIGTGINTDPEYAALVCRHLSALTGLPIRPARDLIEATQDTGAFVEISGLLKRIACRLSKSCNDLRLLSSGPRAGLNEIQLPARAAGSSIMPGKVNPVIPEVVNQIAFEAIGNDLTVTMAAEAGQLQLNAFEPVIAWSLHKTIAHLIAGCQTLARHCVQGITADADLLARRVHESAGLATALNPYIGYEAATRIAQEAMAGGRGVAELALEQGLIDEERLRAVLRPDVLTRPYRLPPDA